jgi:outer membrane lipoprotein SlyB
MGAAAVKSLSVLLLALPLGLSACSPSYSPDTYAAGAAQQAAKVARGEIVGVRAVLIRADGTVGAVSGGAAGGVAGSQSPGGAIASAFGAIGGSLLGGIAGSAAEQAVADAKGYEYIVLESNGHLVSVAQTDRRPLPIGMRVLVIAGKQARVVPDYTVDIPHQRPGRKHPPELAAAPPAAAATDPKIAPPPATLP